MTYDPALPTPKDRVRFLLGDKTAPFFFQNSEIDFLLTENGGNIYSAAIQGAEQLESQFSTKADKTVGPLRISYASSAKGWAELSTNLRRKAGRGAKAVFTGKERPPHFRLGMPNTNDYTHDSQT